MYFLHAINSDRQTRLLNVLGQIAVILGDKINVLCSVVQNGKYVCYILLLFYYYGIYFKLEA